MSNVNIPNTAKQIENLPADAIVETNAVFEREAIRPVAAGALPEDVRRLIMPHLENHETTIKAALTCDRNLVVDAYMNDPLVKGKQCKREEVSKLVDDMIQGTIKYLPDGWK